MKKLLLKIIGFYLNTLALVAPKKAGFVGFRFFCRPFRGKLAPNHHQFFSTAQPLSMVHNNVTIKGYAWGTGPKKVLFLHGWQSHTYRWKNYIEALDKNEYTIYAFDAPGHGLSSGKLLHVPLYGEVIKSFIDKVGTMDSIVSHSIGGFTAIYTLHQYPELSPEKLVVMASPGEANDFFSFYTQTLGLTRRSARLVENHFIKETGKAPSFFSAKQFATSLTISGLLIHDEGDEDTSVENAKNIHRAWKKSRLVITNGIGHNLKSQEVIDQVIDFISTPVPKTHTLINQL